MKILSSYHDKENNTYNGKSETRTVTKYYKKVANAVPVNLINITGTKITGFTSTSFACFQRWFAPTSGQSWEIVVKFNTTSATTNQVIFGNYYGFGGYGGVDIRINTNGTLALRLSNSSSDWSINNSSSTVKITANKWYWVKVTFNGTNTYTMWLSEDGIDYQSILTKTSTTIIAGFTYCIGVDYHGGNKVFQLPFQGQIDTDGSYIKINDEIFWNGTHLLETTADDPEVSETREVIMTDISIINQD